MPKLVFDVVGISQTEGMVYMVQTDHLVAFLSGLHDLFCARVIVVVIEGIILVLGYWYIAFR